MVKTTINLNEIKVKLPSGTVGIDMGKSLTKIARIEDNNMILTTLQTHSELKEIIHFLNSKISQFQRLNFTGGKAFDLYKKISGKIEAHLFNEFQANVKGLEFLNSLYKKRVLPPALIVTIGTGTSVLLKKQDFKHVGGSAIGGGFFMGLIRLLYNITNYKESLKLARKGNRYNVDLKVSDIYAPEDERVDMIFREFTAATLGKIDNIFDLTTIKSEDVINSLISTIGEILGTMACLMAENHDVENLVFCGGFLKANRILKKILSVSCRVHRKKAVFLDNSEYNGAIGALLL